MLKVGVIGGTVLFSSNIVTGAKIRKVKTKFGKAIVFETPKFLIIKRHGLKRNIPPHKINHQANIAALKKLGATKIISICSTGSLKQKIKPSSIIIPDDFIGSWNTPTIFNDVINHKVAIIDEQVREEIILAAKKIKMKVLNKGVYVQTTGPRFETKAEIRMLKDYADIVGMNLASEITIANELGIPIASICSADNYANGIGKKELSYKEVVEVAQKNQTSILKLLETVLK